MLFVSKTYFCKSLLTIKIPEYLSPEEERLFCERENSFS